MKPRVIIWGASGHARVVADIVRVNGSHDIAGFIDDVHPERAGADFEGAKIIGGQRALHEQLTAGVTDVIVAFGDCDARLAAATIARNLGFTLASAIHPSAVIASSARIGAGTVVAANAVVNPGAAIGENVILNTGCSVDHDCSVGDGAHISPGARLGGAVRIGDAAWIGIGAVIADHRVVGTRTVIGAGAVVVRDIPPAVVAYGVPARVMRRRE